MVEKFTVYNGNKGASIAPLSQALGAGELVFVSGQVARTLDGEIVGTTVGEQTSQTLRNLETVLGEAGLSLNNVIRTTVYLTSIEGVAEMNGAYAAAFSGTLPTRTTVEVSALANPAYLVEIDAIAVR